MLNTCCLGAEGKFLFSLLYKECSPRTSHFAQLLSLSKAEAVLLSKFVTPSSVDALDIKLEDTDKLNSTDDKHLRQVRTILTEVIYPIISGMVVKSLFSIICKVYLFKLLVQF